MSAFLPILLSVILLVGGASSIHLPLPPAVEELRWQQPVCTTAGPCYAADDDEYRRVLEVREVREIIDLSEIEPASLDELVLYEKGSPSILVTRVLDSPVLARIVSDECIDHVPTCSPYGQPTRIAIQLPEQTVEDYVLDRTIEAVLENEQQQSFLDALSRKKDSVLQAQNDYVSGYVGKKKQAIQQIVDGLSEKKDTVVQTVVNGTKSVVEAVAGVVGSAAQAKHDFVQGIVADLNQRKDQVIEAVVNAAQTKYAIAEGLAQQTRGGVGAVVDAVNRTVSSVVATKQQLVGGVVHKGAEVVEEKQQIVEQVVNATAAKYHELVVQEKQERVQAVDDAEQQIVSNASAFVEGIVQKKKDGVQAVVDAVSDKKQQIVEAAANATEYGKEVVAKKQAALQSVLDHVDEVEQQLVTRKQGFVQDLADKKINAIKAVAEKVQEYIGTASLIRPLVVSHIKQALHNGDDDNKLEESIDEGDDFAFVDDAGREKLRDDETQERNNGFANNVLETIEEKSSTDETVEVVTNAAAPSGPAESTPIEENVELLTPTTTEKVIDVAARVLPAFAKGPTAVEEVEVTSATGEPELRSSTAPLSSVPLASDSRVDVGDENGDSLQAV